MMVGAVKERLGVRDVGSPARERALTALFDDHYRSLRGLAYLITGDSARSEEIVMEAFVKAISGWNRFRRVDNPRAYLRQIVVNLCRARFRREKVEQRVNALVHRRDQMRKEPEHERYMDLWNAVRRLPERQRACVVLRYFEDMSEAEIAQALDCSIGTVKSQLFKARGHLERELTSGGEERG